MALTPPIVITIDCADPAALTRFWSRARSVPELMWSVLADPEGNEFCVCAAE